ncbi:hypothetical protein WP12_16255 [Sphingomonas sp. SRS2]|nr:hypothetical protein WP12_16255 [Sphingomonas sp. SRS2]
MKLPGQAPQKSPPTSGTTNSTPLPRRGDVLNYVFLFAREAQAGRDEGVKARPVMVMAVVGRRVTVIPLTTKGDDKPASSLAIPAPVASAMGVGGNTGSSLVPGELNAFEWVGHDLRPIDKTGSFLFGRCTPGFFATALDACLHIKPLSRD